MKCLIARLFLLVSLMVVLAGCAVAAAPTAAVTAEADQPVALLIQGYNYTDDYIESFTVNGQGGGNIFESGPASGGGKSVCCVSYAPGTPLPIRLKVRWIGAYCQYQQMSPYGLSPVHRRGLWREAEAWVSEPPRGQPRALEVHFYPDGHVEAAVTEGHSPPRLRLQRNAEGRRPGVSHDYPWCTDDQLK
ncbi:DUF3304 domain-containing protein [Ideonella sp. BN130291]|uniref:DUF3304 domain-containing protein n=1 Tax=Ideonella sp. BN130291 TaxID=3112940 RepID=UPI002E264588|nr:DUF3304 domain-containing protein [Ideonella sp. BN130291]